MKITFEPAHLEIQREAEAIERADLYSTSTTQPRKKIFECRKTNHHRSIQEQ